MNTQDFLLELGTEELPPKLLPKLSSSLKDNLLSGLKDSNLDFTNVKVFKQDERLFEIPNGYKVAPVEDLDDVNELLKTMVKRS